MKAVLLNTLDFDDQAAQAVYALDQPVVYQITGETNKVIQGMSRLILIHAFATTPRYTVVNAVSQDGKIKGFCLKLNARSHRAALRELGVTELTIPLWSAVPTKAKKPESIGQGLSNLTKKP